MENAFGIFKKTFRELLGTSQLHASLVPDVVSCCCILPNLIFDRKDVVIDRLMDVLAKKDQVRH